MPPVAFDRFDRLILDALQRDGALTNAQLSQVVNLSPSQCSRRRAALETAGVIEGYRARLDAGRLGLGIRVVVRVNLRVHDKTTDSDFSRWIDRQPEIQSAFSVSGDADYVLHVRARDLESFSTFLHERLLQMPQISQVRSDFVLKTLKDSDAMDLSGLVG
ncbi:AsnC family transcriptional regulator [Salipiger sp. CCB-MM3]|nr:AsnC family transcriptional regulator [Salipiger sp. CCB-MM3]